MRTALLILALLAAQAAAAQTVWKWVDEKGVTHYSDRPVPGAQRMELSTKSRSSNSAPSYSSSSSSSADSNRTQQQAERYSRFEIGAPANQETFVNTGGNVDVRMTLEPGLQSGHSVHLYLDGQVVQGFPTGALEFTLQGLPRGEHSLQGVIQDSSGRRVTQTPTVTFTVRQESIANPPVGPTLRNPPKPQRQQGANKLPTSQPSYEQLNGQRPRVDPRTNLPVKQ